MSEAQVQREVRRRCSAVEAERDEAIRERDAARRETARIQAGGSSLQTSLAHTLEQLRQAEARAEAAVRERDAARRWIKDREEFHGRVRGAADRLAAALRQIAPENAQLTTKGQQIARDTLAAYDRLKAGAGEDAEPMYYEKGIEAVEWVIYSGTDLAPAPARRVAEAAVAAYRSAAEPRRLIVDWTENGYGIILDPSTEPPHRVVGTHDLSAADEREADAARRCDACHGEAAALLCRACASLPGTVVADERVPDGSFGGARPKAQ